MHFGTSASRFPLPLWVAGPRCPCRRQLNCVRSRAAGPGCRSLGLGRTYVRLLGFPWVRNGGLSRCLGVVERFAGLWRVVKNAHVSACYIAASLKDNGSGQLTTIDLDSARERDPHIEELLHAAGLLDWVHPIYTPTSYTWELMRTLERQRQGEWLFDFAFIDGAHSWFVDGLAFFLVDKLLKPGAWILFDDLDWTYATSPTLRETDFVRSIPEDERTTPQIGKVFDLLVRQRHIGIIG
jgi:Methyltransferase domain